MKRDLVVRLFTAAAHCAEFGARVNEPVHHGLVTGKRDGQ
jgi:hypothetical protein